MRKMSRKESYYEERALDIIFTLGPPVSVFLCYFRPWEIYEDLV